MQDRKRSPLFMMHVLLVCVLIRQFVADAQGDDKFNYRNRKVVFDSFKDLFGQKGIGPQRLVLFEKYLLETEEGRRRVEMSGSAKPEAVWRTLAIEEKTTFLAITAALGKLEDEKGSFLDWIESIVEIHGETQFPGGRHYMNNEAFRIHTKLHQAPLDNIIMSAGKFRNLCTRRSLGYDGLGSRHPDMCRPGELFEIQRGTDNHPRLHFNFTPNTRCVDIDIDYERGLLHLTRDNSNVLASDHARTFQKEYCDPGFRFD